MEQLRTLVARLHMILLDRSRPLWQYYVIEGLEGGGFAVYVKMHHSGIDGGAGMAALDIIFGASPEPVPVAPPPVKSAAAEPTLLELVGKTYEDFWAQQRRMLEALAGHGQGARECRAPPDRGSGPAECRYTGAKNHLQRRGIETTKFWHHDHLAFGSQGNRRRDGIEGQ